MAQEYKIKRVGTVDDGIDGSDEFFNVTCDEPIDKASLWEHFHDEFYYESQQEAGGYFCKRFEVYTSDYEYHAVVKVEHRYDV
jgi:hypothetical protein